MYTPIVATLGYILSPDKKKTLLVHRNKRDDDQHLGKYNGLGGKMEPEEDIYQCLVREIYEEAGIHCTEAVLRGTINWTGFGPNGENWFGFIYRIDAFEGVPRTENEEGKLDWVDIDKIMELPMWEGDKYFLPLVFDDDSRIFHGYMPYENAKPLGWQYTRI
ncbi:NUDIX hydrolase [Desulfosediminicola flagellatus]|uniref:NUDIX hydrolase n=1 Tax=Desulfosediminicola flagellatus TaxID=2569541 RepID=UPI0010AD3A80|nr:8-oxo-dGTP diphosphatase [Desulfosediminicola flagellatus]